MNRVLILTRLSRTLWSSSGLCWSTPHFCEQCGGVPQPDPAPLPGREQWRLTIGFICQCPSRTWWRRPAGIPASVSFPWSCVQPLQDCILKGCPTQHGALLFSSNSSFPVRLGHSTVIHNHPGAMRQSVTCKGKR